jgi:hypothetical protein
MVFTVAALSGSEAGATTQVHYRRAIMHVWNVSRPMLIFHALGLQYEDLSERGIALTPMVELINGYVDTPIKVLLSCFLYQAAY